MSAVATSAASTSSLRLLAVADAFFSTSPFRSRSSSQAR